MYLHDVNVFGVPTEEPETMVHHKRHGHLVHRDELQVVPTSLPFRNEIPQWHPPRRVHRHAEVVPGNIANLFLQPFAPPTIEGVMLLPFTMILPDLFHQLTSISDITIDSGPESEQYSPMSMSEAEGTSFDAGARAAAATGGTAEPGASDAPVAASFPAPRGVELLSSSLVGVRACARVGMDLR